LKGASYLRTIIVNGHVVPGDDEKILRDHSIVVEDGIIQDVIDQAILPYDPADNVIDARGALIIPGIINHHSHGGVAAPFNCFGEKTLSLQRILYNLNRHTVQGTTTLINACGWPTIGEIEIINKLHPLNIRGTTAHSQSHLKHARFVDGQGIKTWHEAMTLETMLERGAVAIGEAGPPCAAYGTPQIGRELGVTVSVRHIENIKRAVLGPGINPSEFDESATKVAIKEAGLEHLLDCVQTQDLIHRHVLKPYEMTKDCIDELSSYALQYSVPMLFHNTRDTMEMTFELASRLGRLLIALHTNYTFTAGEAVACAREIKKHGAWVDIFTGDAFGVRMFHQSPEVAFALFREGLVDLVSTDYIAGYWDPILLVMEKAIEADLITLPGAIQKISHDVVTAIPRIGTERGVISEGKVADLAIVNPKRISEVDTVIIGGCPAVQNGRIRKPRSFLPTCSNPPA
jgi:predicted amidohydrolase